MTQLKRIKKVLDYYLSMGVNKEKINTIYFKILKKN